MRKQERPHKTRSKRQCRRPVQMPLPRKRSLLPVGCWRSRSLKAEQRADLVAGFDYAVGQQGELLARRELERALRRTLPQADSQGRIRVLPCSGTTVGACRATACSVSKDSVCATPFLRQVKPLAQLLRLLVYAHDELLILDHLSKTTAAVLQDRHTSDYSLLYSFRNGLRMFRGSQHLTAAMPDHAATLLAEVAPLPRCRRPSLFLVDPIRLSPLSVSRNAHRFQLGWNRVSRR